MPSTVAQYSCDCHPPQTIIYVDIPFTITGDHVIMWAGFN